MALVRLPNAEQISGAAVQAIWSGTATVLDADLGTPVVIYADRNSSVLLSASGVAAIDRGRLVGYSAGGVTWAITIKPIGQPVQGPFYVEAAVATGAVGTAGPPGPQGAPGPSAPGRVDSSVGNLGAAKSIALTSNDDQGYVDVPLTLTADGVLTITGIEQVSRCTIRITATQDGTGNHALDIKNGTGSQVATNPNATAGSGTFIYCFTVDGTNLSVITPAAAAGTNPGGGIADPTVTGTLGGTNVLTAHPAANLTSVTYQWQKDSVNIGAATNATYTQQAGDAGHNIRVQVTGTPIGFSTQQLIPSTTIAFVATANQSTFTASTLNVLRPTGSTDADILFAEISIPAGSTTTVTIPATTGGTDWTPMGSGAGGTVAAGRYQDSGGSVWFLYWKRLAAGDATTTWGFAASGSSTYRSRVVGFRNAIASGTPFEGFVQAFSASGTTFNAQSLTPTATNEMYVTSYGYNASFTTTFTPGLTLAQAAGADYQNFGYVLIPTSGVATGTTAATVSGAARKNIATWLVTHP